VVLAATLLIGWFIASPADYKTLGLDTVASALFVPNLVFWNDSGYFGLIADRTPLLHLWSLGIEEQFYLIWPAILLLLVRYWKIAPTPILCALSAVSLIYSCVAAFHDPVAAFYSPLSRMWNSVREAFSHRGVSRFVILKRWRCSALSQSRRRHSSCLAPPRSRDLPPWFL
jgi:peptidoglycan/LPS O-acetylase OafA/YrhL